MRIDGTGYWKEFFFISVPFQWNSREFLLKKWEKENIPFAQSHNTVRDARLKHSWNPMMKMSVFCFGTCFWVWLEYLKRHLCHVLYFCPTIIFHSWKNGAFFFLCYFTHRILVIFHDHVVKSECEFRSFFFGHVIPWDLLRLRFRLLQRMNTFDNRENLKTDCFRSRIGLNLKQFIFFLEHSLHVSLCSTTSKLITCVAKTKS